MNLPQKQNSTSVLNNSATAIEAVRRGYQPVPLVTGGKRSVLSGWARLRWENSPEGLAFVQQKFDEWAANDQGGIGVLCGEPSGDLIDIDLDHPKTRRLKDHFLPPTAMRSGRGNRPNTHYWYRAAPGTLQKTRTYLLPKEEGVENDKRMIVEYRSTGAQTALPGNLHPDDDTYIWAAEPWGGDEGPTEVDGQVLAVQVALLGFCTLLVNYWPGQGGRHEAYLALAGGLLRVGEGVHPYWRQNVAVVIGAIADATDDDEGPEGRISETVDSTIKRLSMGETVQGFGRLGEIIGVEQVKQARVILAEIESLAGVPSRTSGTLSLEQISKTLAEKEAERVERIAQAEMDYVTPEAEHVADGDDEQGPLLRDPLEERLGSWEALDLDPYLTGQVQQVMPTVMERVDGQALMYPGRLNMLYGPSESAKSWIAMYACIQAMERGERVVYLDFEDEPVNALQRMQLLGASYDDLRSRFSYVRPEEPLAPMQRSRWGGDVQTEPGKLNQLIFQKLLDEQDPALIIADGMTVLYGLHGLDSNDSVQTDIITSWLKTLSRNGRSTVIVVDHTAKNPQRGSMPIGSQHKVSMVMGSLLQAYPVKQPMPGAIGEIELIVLKDRPGQVRKIAEKSGEKAQLAARVIIDSTTDGVTLMALQPPTPAKPGEKTQKQTDLDLSQARAAERADQMRKEEDQIVRLFAGDLDRELSKPDIYAQVLGSSSQVEKERRKVDRVVDRLLKSYQIEKLGNTRDTTYRLLFTVEGGEERIDLRP